MKGLKLFLATCFVVPMFTGAMAADNTRNTARATQSGRGSTTNVSTARKTTQQPARQERAPAKTGNIVSRTASNKNVVTRSAPAQTPEKTHITNVAPRNKKTSVARTATKTNALTRATNAIISRVATKKGSKSRAATTNITRESIMQRNFSKCKTVFFECMDEFCAQKNAQLKRCACSARAGEFTATQKSLDAVEDKLLDFSQHLLKVNMDPADAAVINQESEGERAYNQTKDKTASKKVLDEISNKLKSGFDSAENGTGMGALSWSLNIDSAFDSVDSLAGVSTTAKSGTALRNAALPVCREMAAEVCTDDDISLVENSYTMAIEQDCNTVKKAYETQSQAARTKILEGNALLDMTRLNTYQENNADDILTCKSKMLEMLSNTNVCGEHLTKCLDVSGRYINPTTGEAFLSPDLVNLSTLIVRPTSTDSWTNVPANAAFITYLNSKKKYIESATKNCQAIADDVWNVFIEDALAQIKLAQIAKLEEVRQSCTTLLTECIANANDSLENFDSRALSIFGIMTDKTANAMCEKIKTSCTAIMEHDVDGTIIAAGTDRINWSDGTTDIAAMETYNRIISTCRQIGRDCIVNSCKSITGNFGLCENIYGSVNRHSIVSRANCWSEVYNCVAQASDESIQNIKRLVSNPNAAALYTQMYGTDDVYDLCKTPLNNSCDTADTSSLDCDRCRLTEQIWGNCDNNPQEAEAHILTPTDPNTTTLLSWFAKNTHTNSPEIPSCIISTCAAGQMDFLLPSGNIDCAEPSQIVDCNNNGRALCLHTFDVTSTNNDLSNCCNSDKYDQWGNCCIYGNNSNVTTGYTSGDIQPYDNISFNSTPPRICTPGDYSTQLILLYNSTDQYIFCAGTVSEDQDPTHILCSGKYIVIDKIGNKYYYRLPSSDNIADYSVNYFININADPANDGTASANYCPVATATSSVSDKCEWNSNTTSWQDINDDCNLQNPAHWLVQFSTNY